MSEQISREIYGGVTREQLEFHALIAERIIRAIDQSRDDLETCSPEALPSIQATISTLRSVLLMPDEAYEALQVEARNREGVFQDSQRSNLYR